METYKYMGFDCTINPVYESPESRFARGDYKSKIIGYRYRVHRRGSFCFEVGYKNENDIFLMAHHAIEDFQNRIDAIFDSL